MTGFRRVSNWRANLALSRKLPGFADLDHPGGMRRESDRQNGDRTGLGRRARDRILSGQTAPAPILKDRYELQNMILFLGDDLRESALAVGGIEAFLLRAQQVLEKPDLTVDELRELLEDDRVIERMDLLSDAISSLRRSIGIIQSTLDPARPR